MTSTDRPARSPARATRAGARPFVFDTRVLGRRPGALRAVQTSEPLPEPVALEMIGVAAGTPLELDLRFESVAEGVLLSGTVATTAEGECGRCLDPVRVELDVPLTELFAYPGSATDETTDADELPRVVDDHVHYEPTIRDAIVLALPLTPLCRPDCEGLCAGCGEHWADLPDDHTHELADPRWAALRDKITADPDTR